MTAGKGWLRDETPQQKKSTLLGALFLRNLVHAALVGFGVFQIDQINHRLDGLYRFHVSALQFFFGEIDKIKIEN